MFSNWLDGIDKKIEGRISIGVSSLCSCGHAKIILYLINKRIHIFL
jgi:hypothetical protein